MNKIPGALDSFDSLKAMTKYIESAINDAGTECGLCAKNDNS